MPTDPSAKQKGSKILTPDIHTALSAKHVKSPVNTRGQQDTRALAESRDGIRTDLSLAARLTTRAPGR